MDIAMREAAATTGKWTVEDGAIVGRQDPPGSGFGGYLALRALQLYPEFADAGIALAQKGKGDSLAKLGKRDEALAAYGVAVGSSDKAIKAFNNATPLDKAISLIFWFSSGNLSLSRKAPSKKPYWNGDQGWIVISFRRQ